MSKQSNSVSKKILFISPNLEAAGAQRQLINIANGFHQRRYDVSVFLFSDEGDLKNSLDKNIKIFSPSSITAMKKFKFLWIARGIFELFRIVLIEKPDMLYSRHWPKMPMTIIGRILRVKTVSGEGNNLKQTLLKRRKFLLFYMRQLCARLSDKVVANSQSLGQEIKEVFKLDSNVAVIYNGIDIENIREKSLEKKTHKWFGAGTPVIIAIGSLKTQKGFLYLLQALEIVNKTRTVRLIIIGNGEKKEFIDISRRLSIEEKTDFLSAVPNPFPYIKKADIFVCSSLYEGLSNVILEALALGKPIISTDHKHGANEIIEDKKSGILVPIKNPENMAEAILKVLDKKQLCESLGGEARKRSKIFSGDKMISKYEELFNEIWS